MNNRRRSGWWIGIWFLLGITQLCRAEEAPGPLRIVEANGSYVVLELSSPPPYFLKGEGGAVAGIGISGLRHDFVVTDGGIRLPEVVMVLEVPANTQPVLKLTDCQWQRFAARLDNLESAQGDSGVRKKSLARLSHRLAPFSLVELEEAEDGSRLKVKFHPVVFDAENGYFEFYSYLKAEISFVDLKNGKGAAQAKGPQSSFYKITIAKEGMYRLTKEDLEAAGIDLEVLKPRNIALLNKDRLVAVNIVEGQGGKFESLEFFGQANHSRYSSENIYWLRIGANNIGGLTMPKRNAAPSFGKSVDFYMEEASFEENFLYQRSILEGAEVDHWFWKFLLAPNTVSVDFPLSDIAEVGELAAVKVRLQGYSRIEEVNPDHHVLVYLNGNLLGEAWWDGATQYLFEGAVPLNYLINGNNTLRIESPADTGAEVDTVYLDYFTVTYPRSFVARDNLLKFTLDAYGKYRLEITGFSRPDIELLDISRPWQPVRLLNASVFRDADVYQLNFSDKLDGETTYLLFTADKQAAAGPLIKYFPSLLLSRRNRADYVIITHPDFKAAVMPLAEWRRNKGWLVEVVDVGDIYSEFNCGIFDPAAIKKFLRYAYNNWQRAPRYVLLVGDASYDYKDYLGLGGRNFVPTYDVATARMLAPSDNWFVCLDDGDDVLPDMTIGRLPVSTPQEAEAVINKIIEYESGLAPPGWGRDMLFVADNQEEIFQTAQDNLIANFVPPFLNSKKLYLSYYLPDADRCGREIIEGINSGAFMVNYMGHGAEAFWANEFILKSSDAVLLANYRRYPVMAAMTCLNTYFHYPYPWFSSLSEAFLKGVDKGAIAYWSPSGLTSPEDQKILEEGFYAAIFHGGARLLGDAVKEATEYLYRSSPLATDLLKTSILLGDPLLELDLPE
ncbi:MAG: C25 family cysteine peptidase [Candidatus Omnitrophota bacterium]